jgi:CHAT domain-containing protein/tetratricopeptide (TPR) repeat protein
VQRGDPDAAVARFERAVTIDQTLAPQSLDLARTLDQLGIVTAKKGDFAGAGQLFRRALSLREALAPGTTELMRSFNNLGILARRSGDLAAAEEYLTRGEELQRRLAPGTSDHALLFQNLGNVALDRGDLERAEGLYRQGLAIFAKTAPGGEGEEACLERLGTVAMQRGDLAESDGLLRRALALRTRRAPDPREQSDLLLSLGNLAARRGDLEAAEALYREAVEIREASVPGWGDAFLGNLGIVFALRGDFIQARSSMQRAVAADENRAPGSLDLAASLERIGRLELDSGGDLSAAEGYLRRALAIYEEKAPRSLGTSDILRSLGEAAVRRGNLPEALALHRRALELQATLAPETTGEAEALFFLGRAERRAGQAAAATRDLCRAVDVLDGQRGRLGGPQEVRSAFEASLGDYYFACLDGLLGLGRTAEAFHVLERGRARSFLALLGDRDLRLADLPPELAAERRHLDADYDRVQARIARLDAGRDAAEIERLTAELRELRTRQGEVLARLRKASPRSAALEAPEPLDLDGARAALDPGTVLLSYAVGPEASWLFVVRAPGARGPALSAIRLSSGAKALRAEVEAFRRLLDHPGSDLPALRARARRLYRRLVQPAEPHLAGAQRLLVAADGALHTLPFAALLRRDGYLVEWKPVESVLSATVYAELVRARPVRPGSEDGQLAAFGDPVYPAALPDDPEVRRAAERNGPLQSLPSSRAEVEAIAALYPRSRVYLGGAATEEAAKALGPESRLVHFACHGLLDERFPLNSALALSLPERSAAGRDNGLLQAWEIFESLRLDADLVTLSACDTALGKDMGGEGLLGLTRAFQYAGARAVLASLWSVSDASTAGLMQRFYRHLRDGRTKDEALQAAQIELIRSKTFSHPYHWAAFQLAGDGR